ncbi:MAG: ABC transporter substrate-binding protein [Candidatus Gottesmanbacteria bacterium]|nr:ABC transporter substrate-binding protein [Candidatus Gottesmanbacteria bacterium]
MTLLRKGRLVFLIARELSHKHTKALVLGFVSGLFLSIGLLRLIPLIKQQWFMPVKRIGMVGEFTPATLPLSIQQYISNGLTTVMPDGTVTPGLATSWTATDSGKTFIFTLRADAVWHNGKKVAAGDINYNIRNVVFSPIDQFTLRANLKAPYSAFPIVVAKPLFLNALVGLGAYRVSNVQLKGDSIVYLKLVLVRGSSLHEREYRFYNTEAEAILAYKLGEVNEIDELSAPGDLTNWGKSTETAETNYNRIISVYFNVTDSQLSDKAIRQALAFAIPYRTDFERAYSPISETSWAYSDKIKKYSFDMAQAKKLFGVTREGSSSGHLTISTFAPYLSDAQGIAASWTTLGITTDVRVENSVPENYQVLLSAQDVPPDPDQYPLWHSTQTQTNITNYANVKIDKLLEDGRQEMDITKRKSIYADFQRYLTEDVPAAFLYYAKSYTITRGR